jgi:uncharacterized protein (DUF1499 family)
MAMADARGVEGAGGAGDTGWRARVWNMLLAPLRTLAVVLLACCCLHRARRHPVNDVTTTPGEPPVLLRAGRPKLFTGKLRAANYKLYADLAPVPLDLAPDAAAAWLARVLPGAVPRLRVARVEGRRVELVANTLLFTDDVVIEARDPPPGEEAACLVHMRSASRLGQSDFGVNYERLVALTKAIRKAQRRAA